jgi:serine/threonine protein phosphatase PrpC
MPIRRKVEVLIELANKGDGGDNISVILLEVIEEKKWNIFKKKVIS